MSRRTKRGQRGGLSLFRLTGYELRKIFGRVWILLLFAAALGMAGYTETRFYGETAEYYRNGKAVFEAYGGIVIESSYEGLKELAAGKRTIEGAPDAGSWAADILERRIPYLVERRSAYEAIRIDAERNLKFYTEHGINVNVQNPSNLEGFASKNPITKGDLEWIFARICEGTEQIRIDYERRVSEQVLKRYAQCPQVQLVDSDRYKIYFNLHDSMMYPLLFLTLLLGSVFTHEKECRTELVLGASATGRRGIFAVKVMAAALSGALVMALYVELRTLLHIRLYPLTDWGAPVQSIPFFGRCPYNWSLRTMALVIGALQCLAGALYGVTIALLSCLAKRNLVGMAAGMLWYIGSYLVYAQLLYNGLAYGVDTAEYDFQNIQNGLRHFFYPMLFEPQEFFTNLRLANVSGYPVPLAVVCVVSSVALLGAAGWIVRRRYVNR